MDATRLLCTLLAAALALGGTQAMAAVSLNYEFDDSLAPDSGPTELVNYLFVSRDVLANGGNDFRAFTNPATQFADQGGMSVVQLGMDDYLGLPSEVLQEFDTTQPIQLDLRFRFQVEEPVLAPSPCCPNAILRHIVATHSGDARDVGFQVRIWKVDGIWRLDMLVGGGSFEQGGLPGEGYFFGIAQVFPDEWNDLSLIFRLGDERPRIDLIYNGRPITGNVGDGVRLNLEALRTHLEGGGPGFEPNVGLTSPQLFLGGFPVAEPRGADIDLEFDRFAVRAPKGPADNAELNQILQRFTLVELGQEPADENLQRSDLQTFLSTFNGDWPPIANAARDYFDAYEGLRPPLFETTGLLSIGDFDPATLLTFYLQQWVFDNLFVDGRVAEIAGLAFEAAESYPGSVAAEAPRVAGNVGVDATYHTDPAIVLSDQAVVLRPTGFYAAPGEPVTVRVPAQAAGAGLEVRVGIQRFDMEQTWNIFNRFPRISAVYPVNTTETLVANPFGGGIYLVVPDGLDLGVIDVEVAGAVRMPMYSTLGLPGHSDNLGDFTDDLNSWYVPWFELHGRNFSSTLIMNVAHLYTDPGLVLTTYEDAFDQINRMAGRPLERFRPEWLAFDRFVPIQGTALPASYPMYPDRDIGERFEFFEDDTHWGSPLMVLRPDFFDPAGPLLNQRLYNYTLWHEWGHLHGLPTLEFQEQESNVHLLAAIVYNQTLGADLDTALARSGFQQYGFDEAALDVMFSPNWQDGIRLGAGMQVYGIFDSELRYQTRSWARLVEIAGLYGWDALGAIHQKFYDRGVALGTAVNYGLEDDDFIETGSAALNLNLAPIFDFWGVPPSPAAVERLSDLPVPSAFMARLANYRGLAPRNLAQFQEVYDRLVPTASYEGVVRYDYFLGVFDAELGNKIVQRIDTIACRYFGCLNNDGTPAPTNVQAGDAEFDERVAVTWDPVAQATRYELYRCTTGTSLDTCRRISTVTATVAEDGSADDNPGVHFYRVRACTTAVSCSDFSGADQGSVIPPVFVDGFEGIK